MRNTEYLTYHRWLLIGDVVIVSTVWLNYCVQLNYYLPHNQYFDCLADQVVHHLDRVIVCLFLCFVLLPIDASLLLI